MESKVSGRSSSQRSIRDYPEHLNPFYEDENHKRIRFWKIGHSTRSNSFSIDGLKGLWSFKTFKLKKKSSTLGINKTSESPPMLRRDRYSSQSTIDGGIRHTVDIGLSNNFQRGAPGRSSLQDLNSVSRHQGDQFFIRNNRYRSTVQPGYAGYPQSNRYQSNPTIGPATPLFRSRYNQSTISKGTSQLSVNSNPFDDDYETISEIVSPERTSIRHSSRKKRRAPQPPTAPSKIEATVEKSSAETVEPDETVNITNLTAEIESFVRIADTDVEKINSESIKPSEFEKEGNGDKVDEYENESQKRVVTSRQSPESNDFYPQNGHIEELTVEKIENLGETDFNSNERRKKSPIKIFVRAPTDEEPISTTDEEPQLQAMKIDSVIVVKTVPVEHNLKQESDENSFGNTEDEMKLDIGEKVEDLGENRIYKKINESKEEVTTTPTSSAVEFILENDIRKDEIIPETELKITESFDDLSKIMSDNIIQSESSKKCNTFEKNDENKTETEPVYKIEVRSIPLELDSPKLRRKAFEFDAIKKEPPTSPQRRRSVKEIIESINKCQSLLKVNQDLKTNKAEKDRMNIDLFEASTSSRSFKNKNSFSDRNLHDSNEKEYHHKIMFSDIPEVNNNTKVEDLSNIPLFVEKFNEYSNNNSNAIFEKCVVPNKKKFCDDKVEWNPLPKPRRHRNSPQGSIN